MDNLCCKNCINRTINCHSTCQKYIEFKQDRYKENIFLRSFHTISKSEFAKNLGYHKKGK